MEIFVGNLPFEARAEHIRPLFEVFGAVSAVNVVMKERKDKSRGFCFVEMPDTAQAHAAIVRLNGVTLMGRSLKVMLSVPKVKTEPEPVERKLFVRREFKPLPRRAKPAGIRKQAADRYAKPWERREESKPREGREEQAKPWQKKEESRPGKKRDEAVKPWKKRDEVVKPWKRREEVKPWKRSATGKPWKKREDAQPRRPFAGRGKPFGKRPPGR
ncbi:MAG TPA: RNA-binding protein [Candidatus Omnitrophota bacterium]|nr:RNA-binding protein [Candidatus Omnitrophota bacterium]HRZ14361.1 RNA-binding protein [Candidatus Omnitrophota bacterium]